MTDNDNTRPGQGAAPSPEVSGGETADDRAVTDRFAELAKELESAGPPPEAEDAQAARDRRAGETSAPANRFEGFDAGRVLAEGLPKEGDQSEVEKTPDGVTLGSPSAEHHEPRTEAGHPSPTGPEQRGADLATPSHAVRETGSDEVVRSPIDDNPDGAPEPEFVVAATTEKSQQPEQDTATPEQKMHRAEVERGAKDIERSLADMMQRTEQYREQLNQSAYDARSLVLSTLVRLENMDGSNSDSLKQRFETMRNDVAETEGVLTRAQSAYEEQLGGTKDYLGKSVTGDKINEALAAGDLQVSERVLSQAVRAAADIGEDFYRSGQKIIDEIGVMTSTLESRMRAIEDDSTKRAVYVLIDSLDALRGMTSKLRNAQSDALAAEAHQIRDKASNLAELSDRRPQQTEQKKPAVSSAEGVDGAPTGTL